MKTAYQKKLSNPKWQKKRLEILQRDGWRCVKCKSEDVELQVHHLRYLKGKEPWEHPNELLQTLCADCHSSETVIQKIVNLPDKYDSDGYIVPSLLKCRQARLYGICDYIPYDTLKKVIFLHDHKGCLSVTWGKTPTTHEMETVHKAWLEVGEDQIEHYLHDELPQNKIK